MDNQRLRAFTLLEMLLVIAVMAILASIALPYYLSGIGRDQVDESMALITTLKPAVEGFYQINGEMPVDNATAGLPDPGKLLGNYVDRITLVDGAFHIHFGNKAVQPLQDKQLTVRAIVVEGSPESPISWVCGYSGVPDGMRATGEDLTDVKAGFLPIPCRRVKSS